MDRFLGTGTQGGLVFWRSCRKKPLDAVSVEFGVGFVVVRVVGRRRRRTMASERAPVLQQVPYHSARVLLQQVLAL